MSRVGWKYRERGKSHRNVCEVCGKEFYTNRPDAKTCSPRCRKRLSRATSKGVYEPKTNRTIVINHKSEKVGEIEVALDNREGRVWVKVE